MDNSDLTSTVQEMMIKMAQMEVELTQLKLSVQLQTQPVQQVKPVVSITRRNTLKRLGLALLAGVAATTALGASPTIQAKVIANPQDNGLSNKAGMVVLVPGAAAPSGNGTGYTYGLIANAGSTALNTDLLTVFDTGLTGFGSGDAQSGIGVTGKGYYGVSGSGSFTGVSGYGNIYGVSGFGPGTAVYAEGGTTGVNGYSATGYGVIARSDSGSGTPFRIVPGDQPSSGTPQYGDMYVNTIGSLYIYQLVPGQGQPSWRKVTTT